jgi:anti-sigma factor ChrR (cupin superfamily)
MTVAVAIGVAVEVAARNQGGRREVEYGAVARSLLEGSGSEGQPVATIYRLDHCLILIKTRPSQDVRVYTAATKLQV